MSERASPWGIENSEKSPSSKSLGKAPGFPAGSPPSTQGWQRGAGAGLSLGCPSTQTLLPHWEPIPAENSRVKGNMGVNLLEPWPSKLLMCGWWQLRGEQNLLVATVWGWHKAVVETLLETESFTGGGLVVICTRAPLKFSCVLPVLVSARFLWMIQELLDLFPFQKAVPLSEGEGAFFFTCGTDHFLGSDGLSVISSNL